MMYPVIPSLMSLLFLSSLIVIHANPTPSPSFTYDNTTFYLNGSPYIIIGGQMDPQRIPHAYWRDRLSKARAMGLNTIFSYVYWNLLEPQPGNWTGAGLNTTDPQNDIVTYFTTAAEEGLHVVLRPGPYICGEREFGGFPAWLTLAGNVSRVRTTEPAFLDAARRYMGSLAADLAPLQVSKGGPILMVQVENEYGSFGDDHAYMAAMRDIVRGAFGDDVPLYTNDGQVQFTLAGGTVHGVLAETDGGPQGGFAARDEYVTDPTELGPLLDGEYYTTGADTWGSASGHNAPSSAAIAQFVADMDFVLAGNDSISLYMFHGGTNYGLSNGALWQNRTVPFTTSYDYGAALDESGRTTDLYFALRDTILKYVPANSEPEPPANVPRLAIPEFEIKSVGSLFDGVGAPTTKGNAEPLTMEQLDQAYGFVLYEHVVATNEAVVSGFVRPGDRARDRVIVYVNNAKVGVIDSTYADPANVSVSLQPGDKLQLLVENLGRVDYYSLQAYTFVGLWDPYKGIVGKVSVGDAVLSGWDIYSIPLDMPPDDFPASGGQKAVVESQGSPPLYYRGTFKVEGDNSTDPASLDTFLSVPDGVKGIVWVNGFNLGRYWIIGPQQSLYLPGTVLKAGDDAENEIVVLELEPDTESLTVMGSAERVWENNDDPDYL
ncbi:family 35 glycoside hydrolase [Xylariaceae sp. FL0255]|nr:family 35 glycoside hydrolase [Xylariaceae sp. FL0255]